MAELLWEVQDDIQETEALFYQYVWINQKQELKEWNDSLCRSNNIALLTFEAFAYQWLTTMRENVHPRTYQNYQSKLMNHLLPALGHYPLVEFEEALLDDWWNQLTPLLSETSAYGVYRVLHACLESAVEA